MSGHDTAVGRLRSQGYRMTPQRLSVLDIIAAHPGHVGVDEVWSLTRERHPFVDLATVYRTLQTLKRAGVVTEVKISHKLHFELTDQHNPHHHMVCSSCDAVYALNPDYLAGLGKRLEEEFGFVPALENFTIEGTCETCQQATRA